MHQVHGVAMNFGNLNGFISLGLLHSMIYHLPIVTKELVLVVLAVALFGHEWRGLLVKFKVDNMTVAHVLNNTYSQD